MIFPLVVIQSSTKGVPAVVVGAVVFEVTTTVCCEEQPVPESVIVSVYVPAALTVLVAVAGPPVHWYPTPGVVELPVSVELAEAQVICDGAAMLIFGIAPLAVTFTIDVAVQPLAASVDVTVYVPAALTEAGLAALINDPPFHTIVPLLVPVRVALKFVQSILLLLVDVTAGVVVFAVTFTVEVAVQPLTASVDVTVYVPAVLMVAGFVALINDPPFQTIVPALVPVNETLVDVHVMFPLAIDDTAGAVVLLVTATVCEAVQPLPGSVTVTV